MSIMYCSQCGKQIGEDAKFCPNCGASNQATQNVQQPSQQPIVVNVVNNNENVNTNTNVNGGAPIRFKSRWVAFFLCLFLGFLGAHKFYVGKTGMGILYLCTGGLFGFGWLFDTIALLFVGGKDKWGRPLV